MEKLVDSVGIPMEIRPTILALVTHAFIMGVSESVVQQQATIETLAKLARDLAAPIGIQIKGPATPSAG